MITFHRTLTVSKNTASLNEPLYMFRGDGDILIILDLIQTIGNMKFGKVSSTNVITDGLIYGTVCIYKPSGELAFVTKGEIVENQMQVTLLKDVMDEVIEIGEHKLQIHLFDEDENRLTLPAVGQIYIAEPLCENLHIEPIDTTAIVGSSTVGTCVVADDPAALADGYLTYNWQTGEYITSAKLNNMIMGIDEALSGIEIDFSDYALKSDIPTKTSELTNDSNFLTSVPSEYVTETELNAKGYLTEHQSLEEYAKSTDIPTKTSELTNDSNFLTSVPSEYVTETELNAKGYLTEHQSLEGLASEDYVDDKIDILDQYVKDEIARVENAGDIVNSVEEMTNTNKQYVLSSTNTWWQYKSETTPAGGVLPDVNNAIKWDTCTVYLNQRYNSSNTLTDAPGCATFEFTADDAMLELIANVNPVWVRFKGCSIYSTAGNSTSLKVVGWGKDGSCIHSWTPYSQVLAYIEDENGISNEPMDTPTLDDNTEAPVYAIKLGYFNNTVRDNSTNMLLLYYSTGDVGKFAFSVAVNFANTNAITEADLENVYITFNEPIVTYEEQSISEWYDTGIEYNPNSDNEVVELQTKVTTMETKIDEIENRVETLESTSSTSGGTSSEVSTLPDYWTSRLNDIGDKIDTLQKENGMDTLQFLWCSDIHGVPGTSPSNTTYIGEIGRYMMDKYNIPFFMVSGDIMSQASHSSTDNIWAEYDKLIPMLSPISNEEFLAIRGNHDGVWGSPMEYNGQANQYYHSYIGDKALFNAFMRRQTLDRYKRVFGKDGMYFYIDYHNYRIYMLNSHTFGDNSVNEQGQAVYNGFKQDVFGSEQLQWIADTLMTVEESQQVIFVAHAPITYMVDKDVFANMLVYYRNRDSYTASVDVSGTYWASGTEYSTSTVTKDFANAKGDFMGYFNGHIHNDTISMVNIIPMFSITCAGGDVRDTYYTDGTLTRTTGTATETAIDLVTITSDYIYFTRIGSGYDRKFNRTTNEITIDYDSAYIPPADGGEDDGDNSELTQGEITSEVTWTAETRLSSSSGGYSTQQGIYASNDISVENGDIIRIYGATTWSIYGYVNGYSDSVFLINMDVTTGTATSAINKYYTVVIDENMVMTITITSSDVSYIRVCGNGLGNDSVRVSRNLELS